MPNENDIENTNSDVETNTNSDNEQPTSDATDIPGSSDSDTNTDNNEPVEPSEEELELDDFKQYAKIDFDDDDNLIQIFLAASRNYIQKATGQIYDDSKELHHLLKNLLALHFYENRQSASSASINEVPFTIQNLLTFIQSTSDSNYELQEKEVSPLDTIQEICADPEYFGLSKVIVQGVKLQNLTISQNGTYEAGEEYSGLGKIIVEVLPNLIDKSFTENGTYTPEQNTDGYRNVTINVEASPTLIDKIFTENGTYTPETNTDGYRNVTVNVEQPAEPVLENLTVKSMNAEQIIQPSTGVDGFDKVIVQKINLQDKSINPSTSQQTIQADSAYDGLNQVNISAIQTEQKTVKSSQNPQVIYPTSGKFINQISVEANPLQSKAIAPTTSAQTVQADSSYYGLDHVNISAIQTENKTVKSTNTSQVIYPTSGKFINQITVSPIDLESKIVKSTETQQTIIPTAGKDGISSIIVEPIISEDITTKSTTTQQVINPTSGKDYIKSVVVEALDLETKNITENGTYTPSQGKDGFSSVSVSVSSGTEPDLLYTYRNKNVITASDLTGFTTIYTHMFENDTNLISIDIPEGVTSIMEYAFNGCTNLCHVGLPSTLTNIYSYAFNNCTSLYKIDIPNNCSFDYNSVFANSAIKEITVKKNVTNYGAQNMAYLEVLNVAEGVTSAANLAKGCIKLREINLPSTLTSIGNYLVNSCASLVHLTIPDNVTSMNSGTINTVGNLYDVSFPSGITTMSGSPFQNCKSLKYIYIRGNSSCATALKFQAMSPSAYNNATIVYTEE